MSQNSHNVLLGNIVIHIDHLFCYLLCQPKRIRAHKRCSRLPKKGHKGEIHVALNQINLNIFLIYCCEGRHNSYLLLKIALLWLIYLFFDKCCVSIENNLIFLVILNSNLGLLTFFQTKSVSTFKLEAESAIYFACQWEMNAIPQL